MPICCFIQIKIKFGMIKFCENKSASCPSPKTPICTQTCVSESILTMHMHALLTYRIPFYLEHPNSIGSKEWVQSDLIRFKIQLEMENVRKRNGFLFPLNTFECCKFTKLKICSTLVLLTRPICSCLLVLEDT